MEEFVAEGLLRTILRLLQGILRVVLFIAWDLMIEVVAWYAGWCLLRVVSLATYPKENISEYENASTSTAIIVVIAGFVLLGSLFFGLSRLLSGYSWTI